MNIEVAIDYYKITILCPAFRLAMASGLQFQNVASG